MKQKGIQLTDGSLAGDLMDLKIDVVRDNNGLIIQGFCVGDTMQQNQAMILMASPGEFHFNPTLGVAIDELLLDDDYLKFRHRIREHFVKDGLRVKTLELSEGKPLKIEAYYE